MDKALFSHSEASSVVCVWSPSARDYLSSPCQFLSDFCVFAFWFIFRPLFVRRWAWWEHTCLVPTWGTGMRNLGLTQVTTKRGRLYTKYVAFSSDSRSPKHFSFNTFFYGKGFIFLCTLQTSRVWMVPILVEVYVYWKSFILLKKTHTGFLF